VSLKGRLDVGLPGSELAPVDDGGDSGLDGPEQSGQGGRVDILGLVLGDLRCGEVTNVAKQRLRHVAMGVDEAGHDDRVGGVDHFCIPPSQPLSHLGDPSVRYQYVPALEVANLGIEGEDTTSFEKDLLLHEPVAYPRTTEVAVPRPLPLRPISATTGPPP
jgi:hypothetical protein